VWNDVIHISCSFNPAFRLTHYAQWIDLQKTGAGLLPLVPIPTLAAISSTLIMRALGLLGSVFVLTTEALTSNQCRAGGCSAGLKRAHCH